MPTLAAAEERWRLTIDNAPVGIALVDLDGRYMRVNEALCLIYGLTADELMQHTFQELTHPDDLAGDLEQLEALVAGRITSYRLRKRFLHADGHVLWGDLSVALVRNRGGEPLHFVSHLNDLTEEMAAAARIEQMNSELHEQTARLEQSNADLEAFAMLVSHDLQAPLATVLGYVQLLEAEYDARLDDQGRDWLVRVSRAADRMSQLVTSLLAFSRSGSQLERQAVSVRDLVVEVCDDLDQLIKQHDATVEMTQGASVVNAERARLRQVVQNLVQNAVKYAAPDRLPHVVVSVVEQDEAWEVRVDDNAVGVPQDKREAVFTLFARLDPDEEQPEHGHGIGLAACRRIVERHGGRIWIEDNPAGPGSRFAFTLPR